jgi:hypothetical protein
MNQGPTWLVLLRDISHAAHVQGEPRIVASLVFDMASGLVLGNAAAGTDDEALARACHSALTKPAGSSQPRRPDKILCAANLITPLARALRRLKVPARVPIIEAPQIDEAEDVFDSFVGHMAGRRQPNDFADPEDWRRLIDQALHFYRREPWERFTDEVDLAVGICIDDETASYTAVILGNAGVQRGLVLYPGTAVPTGLRDLEPGCPVPIVSGTFMFTLDSRDEPPPELITKSIRYGWPPDVDVVPVFLILDGDEPSELGRVDVLRLTVAIAAICGHDARGPVLLNAPTEALRGRLTLADDAAVSFTIRQLPLPPAPTEQVLRVHLAGTELLSDDTPVVLGSSAVTASDSLRRQARLYRPSLAGSAPRNAKTLPLVVIIAEGERANAISAKIAEIDLYGVGIVELDGRAVLTLVGGEGAQLLIDLPVDHPALKLYRSRLKRSKGHHLVLVADQASARGAGEISGLFECHLPETSHRPANLS